MASLMQIAREQERNLIYTANFVVFWKTGRSWHAETIALDKNTGAWSSVKDKERAQEILRLDSKATVINGKERDLQHYGVTVKKIAKELYWCYDYLGTPLQYLLDTLTVLEPEPAAAMSNTESAPACTDRGHAENTGGVIHETGALASEEKKILAQIDAMPIEKLIEIVKKSFEDSHISYTIEEGGKILFPGIFMNGSRSPPDNR